MHSEQNKCVVAKKNYLQLQLQFSYLWYAS